jgi:hypothetical protein
MDQRWRRVFFKQWGGRHPKASGRLLDEAGIVGVAFANPRTRCHSGALVPGFSIVLSALDTRCGSVSTSGWTVPSDLSDD